MLARPTGQPVAPTPRQRTPWCVEWAPYSAIRSEERLVRSVSARTGDDVGPDGGLPARPLYRRCSTRGHSVHAVLRPDQRSITTTGPAKPCARPTDRKRRAGVTPPTGELNQTIIGAGVVRHGLVRCTARVLFRVDRCDLENAVVRRRGRGHLCAPFDGGTSYRSARNSASGDPDDRLPAARLGLARISR